MRFTLVHFVAFFRILSFEAFLSVLSAHQISCVLIESVLVRLGTVSLCLINLESSGYGGEKH